MHPLAQSLGRREVPLRRDRVPSGLHPRRRRADGDDDRNQRRGGPLSLCHRPAPLPAPGVGLVDQCTLQLEAGARLLTDDEPQLPTDDEPQLPTGAEAVDRTAYDFCEARLLGPTTLDFAFTDLVCDADGRAWACLGGIEGRRTELWLDEGYPIIELYTGDTLAPERQRKNLGVEPMTCPSNTFASGDDGEIPTRLEPSQNLSTASGARLT